MDRVIVKLRRSGNSTVITIPKEVMKSLNWKDGDYVSLETKRPKEQARDVLIVGKVFLTDETR